MARRKETSVGRTLDAVIGALPKVRHDRINARYRILKNEVESLQISPTVEGKLQTEKQ